MHYGNTLRMYGETPESAAAFSATSKRTNVENVVFADLKIGCRVIHVPSGQCGTITGLFKRVPKAMMVKYDNYRRREYLVLSGHHIVAEKDGKHFSYLLWPEDTPEAVNPRYRTGDADLLVRMNRRNAFKYVRAREPSSTEYSSSSDDEDGQGPGDGNGGGSNDPPPQRRHYRA